VSVLLNRRTFLKLLISLGCVAGLPAWTGCVRRRTLASLDIVPRADWKAADPDPASSPEGLYDPVANPGGWLVYDRPLSEVLTTLVVHHSALPLSDGPLEIQWKHIHQKGYADIGYHFVVDDAGQIYAGRDLQVRGAHTGGHNTGTVGVSLLGNFQETRPLPAQLTSLKGLGACLADDYGITHLAGHRDFQPGVTVCPGDYLEALLPDMAVELGLVFGTGGYDGP